MYADTALERLDNLKRDGSYRTFVTFNRHAGRYPMAYGQARWWRI